MKKSDYIVLPRKECKKPSGRTSYLFIQINKLIICHADDVAFLHEGDLLQKLQENRQIIRFTPEEFSLLVPLMIPFHKERAEIILARNSKKRIIVSTELWYSYVSREKKGFSTEDMTKKIDEVIENLVNKHMYEYNPDGTRKKNKTVR